MDLSFGSDLQNRFEENAKEMRYCSAKLNVMSDVLRDGGGGGGGRGGGKKNHHRLLIKHFRLTKLSECSGVKQVYRQMKFKFVCLNRCQVMGKVHVIFDNPSYVFIFSSPEPKAHKVSL